MDFCVFPEIPFAIRSFVMWNVRHIWQFSLESFRDGRMHTQQGSNDMPKIDRQLLNNLLNKMQIRMVFTALICGRNKVRCSNDLLWRSFFLFWAKLKNQLHIWMHKIATVAAAAVRFLTKTKVLQIPVVVCVFVSVYELVALSWSTFWCNPVVKFWNFCFGIH